MTAPILVRLVLDVPAAAADAATAAAATLGAQGVAIEDTDTGAPPGRARVTSWHPADADPDRLRARARAALAPHLEDLTAVRISVQPETVDWRPDPAPIHIAGFTLGPALDPGPRALRLDPTAAFGGDHPTTALCLAALVDLCAATPPARALDVGTGTGVLALALARLGVPRVTATDIDPLALAAARRHVADNALTDRITLRRDLPPPAFDLIVANLYLGPLLALADALAARLAPGGHLVLAGIIRDHRPALTAALTAAFAPAPIAISTTTCDPWVALTVRILQPESGAT